MTDRADAIVRLNAYTEPPRPEPDWTVNPETGRTNSSEAFLKLCEEVEHLIKGDAHALINGRADMTARLIMAQLAHVHGLAPTNVDVQGAPQYERVCKVTGSGGNDVHHRIEADYDIKVGPGTVLYRQVVDDPEPQPSDGPDYETDHAFWEVRQAQKRVREAFAKDDDLGNDDLRTFFG